MDMSQWMTTAGTIFGTGTSVIVFQEILKYFKAKRESISAETVKARENTQREYDILFLQMRTDVTDLKDRWRMSMERELECEKRFTQIHEDHTKLWRLYERARARMSHLEEALAAKGVVVGKWDEATEEHPKLTSVTNEIARTRAA